MQILLAAAAVGAGDDSVKTPSPSETLLTRLQFADARIEAVHVIPPPPYAVWAVDGYVLPDTTLELAIEKEEKTQCGEALATIADRLNLSSCPCRTKVLNGGVILSLLDRAGEINADLIAVNGTHTKEAMALLEGSVVRSLMVDAACSLLIAKESPQNTDKSPLKVVLATNHSDYANRCIERFLRMAPRGIGAVTVVTAYPMNQLRHLGVPHARHLSVPLDEAVEETLTRRSAELIAHLRERLCSNIDYSSCVVAGDVHQAIATAMEATEADLLVLGARGHGFVSRLTLGSVSYREAVAAPYSVLVLRD